MAYNEALIDEKCVGTKLGGGNGVQEVPGPETSPVRRWEGGSGTLVGE